MSDPRYFPKGFDGKLSHVIEECGEVLAAAGKVQRFSRGGISPIAGVVPETNEDWLLRELFDLKGAIDRLISQIEHDHHPSMADF